MNENSTYFEISENGNLIRIDILGLNYPNAEDDWDRNCLKSIISAKADAFSGNFKADLMTTDFETFKNELTNLYDKLKGIATFNTLESQVDIKITGDGIGHLKAKCEVMDYAGIGNKLEFEIDFDQTQIPKIVNQLENIITKFPVSGDLK